MKIFLFLLFFLIIATENNLFSQQENYRIYKVPSEQYSRYIALVADTNTCTEIMEELDAYSTAIASKDYGVFLLCAQWSDAEMLRLELAYLKDKYAIDGAVFIGNLPRVSVSFNNSEAYLETDFFYENLDAQYSRQNIIGDIDYYKLVNGNIGRRDLYVSRIYGKKDEIQKIRAYLKKVEGHYLNETAPIVNRVVGIIGDNFFGGSKYAAICDAEVWKDTISFFYPKSDASVAYLFSKSYQDNSDVLNKMDNDILLLFYSGDKSAYLSQTNTKLTIISDFSLNNYSQLLDSSFYSMISLPKAVSLENIIPANYHLLFTGQNIGSYYKGLPYLNARLFGDPVFSFAKTDSVSMDIEKDGIRLSKLLGTKKLLSSYNDLIPVNILSALVVDNDEKIRFETINWIKQKKPSSLFFLSDKIMLDPSDRVYKTFVDAMVLSKSKAGLVVLKKNKDYFKKQKDDLRLGLIEEAVNKLNSDLEK